MILGRKRFSVLSLLMGVFTFLILSFQNCAPPKDAEAESETDETRPIHKIGSDAQALSLFVEGSATDQTRNILSSLPEGRPLAVIVRNGQLYSEVQLIVNGTSFLVSEYLKLLSLFRPNKFTVPVFYSPLTLKRENKALEVLQEFRVDVGDDVDSSGYCDSIINKHIDPSEADLLIQIADASGLLSGNAEPPQIYWTLPVQIFNPATCKLPQ